MPVSNKLLRVQRFDSRDLAHYVTLAKTKYSSISNLDEITEDSDNIRCSTSPSQSCRCPEDLGKKRTFLTVFLAKLLDCVALSNKSFSVAEVNFDLILARLEDTIDGETGFIPPHAVGNLHVCVFKKLCRKFGTAERLLDTITAGDPYFEEMVAKVFMQEMERSKQSPCRRTKPVTYTNRSNPKIFLGPAGDGELLTETDNSKPIGFSPGEIKVSLAHKGDGDGGDIEFIKGIQNGKRSSKMFNKPFRAIGEKENYISAYQVGEHKRETENSNASLRLLSKPMRSISEEEAMFTAHKGNGDTMEVMRFKQSVCPKPIKCSSRKEIRVLPAPGHDGDFNQDLENSKQSPGVHPKRMAYISRKRNKVFPAPHEESSLSLSKGFFMRDLFKPGLEKEHGTLRMLFTCCAYTE